MKLEKSPGEPRDILGRKEVCCNQEKNVKSISVGCNRGSIRY